MHLDVKLILYNSLDRKKYFTQVISASWLLMAHGLDGLEGSIRQSLRAQTCALPKRYPNVTTQRDARVILAEVNTNHLKPFQVSPEPPLGWT